MPLTNAMSTMPPRPSSYHCLMYWKVFGRRRRRPRSEEVDKWQSVNGVGRQAPGQKAQPERRWIDAPWWQRTTLAPTSKAVPLKTRRPGELVVAAIVCGLASNEGATLLCGICRGVAICGYDVSR